MGDSGVGSEMVPENGHFSKNTSAYFQFRHFFGTTGGGEGRRGGREAGPHKGKIRIKNKAII